MPGRKRIRTAPAPPPRSRPSNSLLLGEAGDLVLVAALLLQGSFQVLPLFLRATNSIVGLQAFGGLVLLLVWLYVMSNILVLGAEVNWWLGRGRAQARLARA